MSEDSKPKGTNYYGQRHPLGIIAAADEDREAKTLRQQEQIERLEGCRKDVQQVLARMGLELLADEKQLRAELTALREVAEASRMYRFAVAGEPRLDQALTALDSLPSG